MSAMGREHESAVLKSIQTLFRAGTAGRLSDAELLERIGSGSAGVAEAAFEALLMRHGGMVWNVCRNVLLDASEAEDAFQASFLVFLRKAGSIRKRSALGPWLYGVAYRIAVRSKAQTVRKRLRERDGVERLPTAASEASLTEDLALLHEELSRLPEKYRTPVVLCYLEGRTNDDVARQLGWPVGTVSGRLARAKTMLRSRLIRRGLPPSAGLLAVAMLSDPARAAVPERLIKRTLEAFLSNPTHGPLAGATVAGSVASLASGTFHILSITQAKWAVAVLLAGITVATGVGLGRRDAKADLGATAQAENKSKEKPQVPAPAPISKELKPEASDVSNESPLMDLAREELASIEAQRKVKEAGVAKAEAQRELAIAGLARSKRLQAKGGSFVSAEEIQKNEAEVKVAEALLNVARADLEDSDVRVKQAKRIVSHPELVGAWLVHMGRSSAIEPLEKRLKTVEQKLDDRFQNVDRKLDQIVKILDKPGGKP
jgi:RNA polymerase sigma factor (sigma-70 family)